MVEMTRKNFAHGLAALSAAAASGGLFGQSHESTGNAELDLQQSEIDAVTPRDFIDYYSPGLELGDAALSAFFGVDGEEGLVGVDDVVRIVIEAMEAAVGEELAELFPVDKARRAEDAFPVVEFT
jgi:hypothetical protein